MIRVFPSRTSQTPSDELAFVGDPPMFRPPEDMPVLVSVTFSWDRAEGERLQQAWAQHYSDVQIGGPAFDDPGDEFVPGRFLKAGMVITSRGCPRRCAFCFVPDREGRLRELPIRDGWNVQDNNLLACSRGHIEAVFAMLARQRHYAKFAGGLDARLLKQWHVAGFQAMGIDELWFACDSRAQLPSLKRASDLLADFRIDQKRCFVLIGYGDDTPVDAERRLEVVYRLGFLPFAQVYRNADDARRPEWADIQRKWSRPAAYRPKQSKGSHNATEALV